MERHLNSVSQKINVFTQAFDNLWRHSSKKNKILLYIGIYTIIFSLTALIAYSPFITEKKSFVWASDGRYMHWPALIYIGNWLKEFVNSFINGSPVLKMFDINIGMGADIVGTLNFFGFGDPLNIFALIVPTAYIEYLYIALAMIRLYISGLTFSYMCFHFKKLPRFVLTGSIIYCFNGFSFYNTPVSPFFINLMMILPIAITGCDLIIMQNRKHLFIVSIFYIALCGFYLTYIVTVLISIFFIVHIMEIGIKKFRDIFIRCQNISFSYICGIGMAAIVFLPSIYFYINCSRRMDQGISNALFYSNEWYRAVPLLMFSPFFKGSNLECNYLSLAPIVLYALIALFFSQNRQLKIWVIVGLLLHFFPMGGSLMNGFSYATNRWSIALILLFSYIVVEEFPQMLELPNKYLLLCVFGCFAYTIFALFFNEGSDTYYAVIGAVFLAITLLVLLIMHPNIQHNNMAAKKFAISTQKWLSSLVCTCLVIANVGTYGIYIFSTNKGAFLSEFPEIHVLSDGLETHLGKIAQNYLSNNPDGRVEFSAKSSYRNIGAIFQIPTIPFYWNMTDNNISEFWKESETPGLYFSYNLHNSDWRTIQLGLLSMKFYICGENGVKKFPPPYGYTLLNSDGGILVYQNDYSLPWGYTYEYSTSADELNDMDVLQKHEAMLQAVALHNVNGNANSSIFQYNSQPLEYNLSFKGCSWDGKKVFVEKENATITLDFDMPKSVEGYLRLSGLQTKINFNITVNCNGVSKISSIKKPGLRTYERKNYLFNLGYSEDPRTTLTITFPTKGTFTLGDISLYALPMDNYRKQVEALREEPLENIQWETNKISATVDLSKDKILCMSIPYSKGWTATVDGKKVEILRGNYMFMAVPLSSGHHDIEFTYCSPGIKLGIVVSIISLVIFTALLIQDRVKKKL